MIRDSWECSAYTSGTCQHSEWICRDLFGLGGSKNCMSFIESIASTLQPFPACCRAQACFLSAPRSSWGVAAALLVVLQLPGECSVQAVLPVLQQATFRAACTCHGDFCVGSIWSQWWSAKAVSVQTSGCMKAATQSSSCLSQPCSCNTAAELPSVIGTVCWGLLT